MFCKIIIIAIIIELVIKIIQYRKSRAKGIYNFDSNIHTIYSGRQGEGRKIYFNNFKGDNDIRKNYPKFINFVIDGGNRHD